MTIIQSTTSRRRGSAYLLIVAVSMCITAITLTGIAVARSQTSYSNLLNDAAEAKIYALSATELGKYMIFSDTSWRTNRSNGTWVTTQPIGNGSYYLSALNPNGAMNNSSSDPVILTGTGIKGSAKQSLQIYLTAQTTTATALSAVTEAGGGITLTSATITAPSQLIASNGSITGSSSLISGNVESATTVSGCSVAGTTTSGATARTLPSSTDVFSWYTTNGTSMSKANIPTSGGSLNIANAVISPSLNPYGGGTNANGIYIIDCQNTPIQISNSRIIGTLIILNPGTGSYVGSSISWVPAVTNYPCLMVKGDFTIKTTGTSLSEGTSPKTNYNPTGAPSPWPNGSTDTNTTGTYQSSIGGLTYVSGNLTINGSSTAIGNLVVNGTMSITGSVTMNYSSTYKNNPPPSFSSTKMVPATTNPYTQVTY